MARRLRRIKYPDFYSFNPVSWTNDNSSENWQHLTGDKNELFNNHITAI